MNGINELSASYFYTNDSAVFTYDHKNALYVWVLSFSTPRLTLADTDS